MEIKLVMVARTAADCQTPRWKRDLAAAYRHPAELLDALGLDHRLLLGGQGANAAFRMFVSRAYAAQMEPGNPKDPLLRQVLPTTEEIAQQAGFSVDPVADRAATRTDALLQKYHGRALILVTGACAIHCRYCFRRHFPYLANVAVKECHRSALSWLGKETSIHEVILSGGDPLLLEDVAIEELIEGLSAIPHIKRLRVHTRIPSALPSRITVELCRLLGGTRLSSVVVVHINHPRELGAAARQALGRLKEAGLTLLNQSVLLRGVNDEAGVLADLSEELLANSVLPYYLHLLDKVHGASHFEVDESLGKRLVRDLRARLPGYLVPRLVREVPGMAYKRPIC
jgi:EF-P beta-lysylation protein EpmB